VSETRKNEAILIGYSRLAALLLALLSLAARAGAAEYYGYDQGGSRFAPLDQITPENVDQLIPAWTYHTGDLKSRAPDVLKRSKFEVTPILVGDRLIACTPFNAVAALDRLTARGDESVADALLDQSTLAGVGNVFKSEICFVNGLNPFRTVESLTRDEAAATIASAQKLLRANVLEDSGDMIVTYRGQQRRTTRASNPSESLWVYGRAGEPCRRCGETIRRRIQGADARVTFWCPRCQPMPNGADVEGT